MSARVLFILSWQTLVFAGGKPFRPIETGTDTQSGSFLKTPQGDALKLELRKPRLRRPEIVPPCQEGNLFPDEGNPRPKTTGSILSDEPVTLNVTFDQTHCQIHVGNGSSDKKVVLTGTILASHPVIWNLNAVCPNSGNISRLCFVRDVLGRTASTYGRNIPLMWEIALDSGEYAPVQVVSNDAFSVFVPPGAHTFKLRVTGDLGRYQPDGYYWLQLSQSFAPQL